MFFGVKYKKYFFQYFSLTLTGELRREELCAEVQLRFIKIAGLTEGAKGNVTLTKCDGTPRQVWTYSVSILLYLPLLFPLSNPLIFSE